MSGGAPYGLTIPDGFVWKYEQCWQRGRIEHTWSIRGEAGGIHINARISPAFSTYPAEWMGGIEMHKPSTAESAHHQHCWLLGGPCEHDGSSLQFSEGIAPYLPYPDEQEPHKFGPGVHDLTLSIMLRRYRTWLVESES